MTDAPPVWKWYVAYCALMALLYLAVAGCSAIFLVANPAELEMSAAEAKIIGVVGGGLGLMLFIPYAVAPFLPQRPWVWIVGLVLIGIGMTSTCFLPIAVPLLIFWIKPETKSYFARSDAVRRQPRIELKTRSLQPPKLPKQLKAETVAGLSDHAEYTQVVWTGGDFTAQSAAGVSFDQVHLRQVILNRTTMPKARFADVRLEASDLSGAEWEKAHWRRVEFIGCRLLGAQLLEARAEDVLFRDCNLESVVFATAKFSAARFEKCVLRGASFESADLSGVVFLECDLGNADLLGSQLVGADLRGSLINGLRAGAKELKGAVIDPSQAEQIVGLLGLTVKELDV